MYKIQWDKGSLRDNYTPTGEALQAFNFGCTCLKCELGCSSSELANYVDDYYNHIFTELKRAEQISIPSIPHSALRHFWNDELHELKQKSIMWHDIWKNSSQHGSGRMHQIKCSCKLNTAIKKTSSDDEDEHIDEQTNKYPKFGNVVPQISPKKLSKEVYIIGSNKVLT